MKNFYQKMLLMLCTFAIASTACAKTDIQVEQFTQHMLLQLYDWYGVPVPGTQFSVSVKVIKQGSLVTLQLPAINFQTGQFANDPAEEGLPIPPYIPGGYLYTAAGHLPQNVRPTDLVNRSWLVPTDNGVLSSFSFTQDASTLPNPIAGYILQITNDGGIVIQGAGTWGNIIPSGNQSMLPTTISYIVEQPSALSRNIPLSTGATNITQFGPFGLFIGYRDAHINDAYNGVAAWAWVDNSMVADKTNNVLNAMVAVGQQDSKGNLKVGAPVQLTDVQPPLSAAFNTAVAISRLDSDIIVVSYTLSNYDVPASPEGASFTPCRAISFDGGKTWPAPYDGITPQPYNGPINIQPTGPGVGGDYPGVAADSYGNIWCLATNFFTDAGLLINQPFFLVSTDGGVTFTLAYTFPLFTDFAYDGPEYCFGGDGNGNYGIQFTTELYSLINGDQSHFVGFFPITGLGQYNAGAVVTANLTRFLNINEIPAIAASLDGKVWYFGHPSGDVPGSGPAPETGISTTQLTFKSPGDISENYAGPWDFSTTTFLNESLLIPTDTSDPVFGYFNNPRDILYDENRQALYAITKTHVPQAISTDEAQNQNMQIYFAISRDNGATWSSPIAISTTDFANRGFQTMALDTVTGNLVFGWYDGRNDSIFQSVEYYTAIITAQLLDQLVNNIPLSNPLYIVPPATGPASALRSPTNFVSDALAHETSLPSALWSPQARASAGENKKKVEPRKSRLLQRLAQKKEEAKK